MLIRFYLTLFLLVNLLAITCNAQPLDYKFEALNLANLNLKEFDLETQGILIEVNDIYDHLHENPELVRYLTNPSIKQRASIKKTLQQLSKDIRIQIEHLLTINSNNRLLNLYKINAIIYFTEVLQLDRDLLKDAIKEFLYDTNSPPIELSKISINNEDVLQMKQNILNYLRDLIQNDYLNIDILFKNDIQTLSNFDFLIQINKFELDQVTRTKLTNYLIEQLQKLLSAGKSTLNLSQINLIDQIMLCLSEIQLDQAQFKTVVDIIIQNGLFMWQNKQTINYLKSKNLTYYNLDIVEYNPLIVRFIEQISKKKLMFKNHIEDISLLHQLSRRYSGTQVELVLISALTDFVARNRYSLSISDRMYLKSMNLDYLMEPRITCESVF